MSIGNFKEDLKTGKIGEEIFKKYCEKNWIPYTHHDGDEIDRLKQIDFTIEVMQCETTVNVKYDEKATKNIYFQHSKIFGNDKKTSESNFFYHICPTINKIFVYKLVDIKRNWDLLKSKSLHPNGYSMQNVGQKPQEGGFAINIEVFKSIIKCVQEIKLKTEYTFQEENI